MHRRDKCDSARIFLVRRRRIDSPGKLYEDNKARRPSPSKCSFSLKSGRVRDKSVAVARTLFQRLRNGWRSGACSSRYTFAEPGNFSDGARYTRQFAWQILSTWVKENWNWWWMPVLEAHKISLTRRGGWEFRVIFRGVMRKLPKRDNSMNPEHLFELAILPRLFDEY